jgi:pimeloyl-ACP methyl ester carboxylesterase
MTVHAKAEEKTFCRMRLARPQSLLQNSYKIGQVGTAMPEALVRGVRINYEVIGDHGPWIALTPGSRRSFDELIGLSKAIAASGYRVLLHDRRNCGASDVAFDGSGSEHEVWADDLYALGKELGALPMYVGGSSAGARLAILYALRHADGLRGLLLWRVTGGQEAVDRLAENYYGQFIKIAHAGGMQAVCDSEHFSECIKARPSNRDRLLKTNVNEFIAVMTHWRECFLQSANLPIVGATEQELRAIKVPACLIAGNDVIHTPATARKAATIIPNSELHDDLVEKRADNDLLKEWDRKEWRNAEPRVVAIFAAFLKKAESK